ncbi:MAG: hypothetical protein AAGE96_09250 [Cyanobacteria bacterium P01_G01_bin.19]
MGYRTGLILLGVFWFWQVRQEKSDRHRKKAIALPIYYEFYLYKS